MNSSTKVNHDIGKTAFCLLSNTKIKKYLQEYVYKAYKYLKNKCTYTSEVHYGILLKDYYSATLMKNALSNNFHHKAGRAEQWS